MPHPRLGENVGAAVVLKDGGEATSSALIEFLHDRLAPFQMPRQVHVLRSLPKGNTGKISRPQLSAAYSDQTREAVLPDDRKGIFPKLSISCTVRAASQRDSTRRPPRGEGVGA